MEERSFTRDELCELQLSMLDCIHDYCTKHSLRYSLGGGTLLGAIRHKGYIPWDDDIDVMLPRTDYEAFLSGFEGQYDHCQLQHYGVDRSHTLFFARVYDDRTECKDNIITKGVCIDVFPIDGMPKESDSKWYFWRVVHAKWMFGLFQKNWEQMTWKEKLWRIMIPSKHLLWKCTNRYLCSFDFESSPCTGCAVGSYDNRELMGPETFKHYIDVTFEGKTYRAIADYDAYLTKHYGNYLTFPPDNERRGHNSIFCWKSLSKV